MVEIWNKIKKQYHKLPAAKQQAHLTDLEEQYGENWNDQISGFYQSLFKAMGRDFVTPKIDEHYKKHIAELAGSLERLGKTTHEDEVFQVYNTKNGGQLLVNHNNIRHEGSGFNAAIGYEMSFLAVHDKDMIKQGVTLQETPGTTPEQALYEKSILQLSILHHNPDIKIHNKLAAFNEQAMKDFQQNLQILGETYIPENYVNKTAAQEFYKVVHEKTSRAISAAQVAVEKSISTLKTAISKMPAALSHANTATQTAFSNTVNNLRDTAERVKMAAGFQPNTPSPS